MRLLFREVRPDEVEQELTQKDQFNTDKVPLAATLVRESHQNSTDARSPNHTGPVRIRIAFAAADPANATFWRPLLSQLEPHLDACEIDSGLDCGAPDFLIIEDFGTTGLTGSVTEKDLGNFSDFWRRVGRSHKSSRMGGSWGLGKLVFPVSSRIRTFFGLTVRLGDPKATPLLMGQTVLATHRIGSKDYAPHGFFAMPGTNGFQIPSIDPAFISKFSQAVDFSRHREPGLSIAIPFPQDGIRPEKLIPLVVEHYFFPILTEQLEVVVGGQTISANTFDAVAKEYGSGPLADGHVIGFIREIKEARQRTPEMNLPHKWASLGIEQALTEQELQTLRTNYDEGKLVHVRAPIRLRHKANGDNDGSFDLFLRRAPDDIPAAALLPLFIRGSVTVPNEESNFKNRRAFAALVATDPLVSSFLRDAENPAHTSWNGNAEKLNRNWRAPGERLREIRHSLRQLHELLDRGTRREDADALKSLINIKDAAPTQDSHPGVQTHPSPFPVITPNPQLCVLTSRKGGFALRPGPGLKAAELPLKIIVQAAYDLPTGNPFKKFSRFDFDFRMGPEIKIKGTGVKWNAPEPNRVVIDVSDPEFTFEVTGFDINRDLVVGAILRDDP